MVSCRSHSDTPLAAGGGRGRREGEEGRKMNLTSENIKASMLFAALKAHSRHIVIAVCIL